MNEKIFTVIGVIMLTIVSIVTFQSIPEGNKKVQELEEFISPRSLSHPPGLYSQATTHNVPIYAEDCGTDINYNIYQIRELYYNQDETITFRLMIHYMPNSDSAEIDTISFYKRIDELNKVYEASNAHIQFTLKAVNIITGEPSSNAAYLKKIELLEEIVGKRRDMRNYYYIDHLKFIENHYGIDGYINIYIINDTRSAIPAMAGEIESTYLALKESYMDAALMTIEHEIGHCLGLLHTHTYSASANARDRTSGDLVCDTHKCFPFSGLVDNNCELIKYFKEAREKIMHTEKYPSNDINSLDNASSEDINTLISNIMSYTRHDCRIEFTAEQIMRMRKIIENNRDLRICIEGIKDNYAQHLISSLKDYSNE